MEEFANWSDRNSLLPLPTVGCNFIWANGRGGSNLTEKRLEKRLKGELKTW